MIEHADVVVVGMGPGGEHVAGRLAEEGLDVVGIEGGLLGGECPYWGCVPSEMMVRAAGLLADARRVAGIAGSVTVNPDWAPVAKRIRSEATNNWDDTMAVERFESRGGRFVRGWGALAGERRVVVGEREFEAECAVVLDVGAKAFIPAVPGLDGVSYWTNRDAVEATEVPASLIVLGGGPVGLELGQVFARFGSKVSIVEEASQLLPREEPESGALIADVLAAEGIDLYVAKHAVAVSEDHSKVTVELSTGETLVADRLLVATGHKADLGALGVGSVGLDEHAQAIPIDEMCLAAPGLWALGSITGVGNSTHVSMYQAEIVAAAILGHETTGADYRAVPRVTFTDPEIASVGLGEAAARSAGLNVRVGHAGLSSSARGWIQKVDNAGFIKLIQDADRSVLVGATSVGPCGGEVLSMLTLAVHGSIPTQVLKTMMYAYPTFHRAVEVALRDL